MDPVIQTGTRPSRFGIDTVIGCELGHAWEKMPVLSGYPWGSVSSDECWWGTEFLFMVLIFSFSDYRILRCGRKWGHADRLIRIRNLRPHTGSHR